jgi:hypothetical protein
MNKIMAMLVAASMSMAVGCACMGGKSECKAKTTTSTEALDSTSYDAAQQVLTVNYAKGGTYEYAGVPQAVADEVAKAESKGKAINELVKGKFKATKVSGK